MEKGQLEDHQHPGWISLQARQGGKYEFRHSAQIKRNRFLNKYLEFIRKDPNQKAPEKWIDIGMYTPYIFTHGVFDPQQSYCYLTKEFDIYMSIVHFGTQVLKSMF